MSIFNQISKIYGINNELIKINDGFQNSIYSFCQSGKDFILRVSDARRRSLDEVKSELVYITELSQAGLNVSVPVLSNNGHLIEEVQERNQPYFITVFEKANGLPVNVTDAAVWNEDLFFHWGKFIGKSHRISKQLQRLIRPEWSETASDLFNLLPRINSDLIAQRYLELLEKLKDFHKNSENFGLIHNDFHQGNFFVQDGVMAVFDFDDCAYHWFSYDLSVSYYHAFWQASSFTPENTMFSEVFWTELLKGYKTEHAIQKEWIEQIPIFLKIREIFLYVLFLEKWEMKEDWQIYTVNDLKYKIENKIPYSNTNLKEIIDSLI
jgi:amicoumacin kinase